MAAKTETVPADAAQTAEIRMLLARAQAGDISVLPELQEILLHNPHIWQTAGDLAWLVEVTLLDLIAGKDLLVKESIKKHLTELKTDLGPSPTRLEKLLVDRIALEWLVLHFADLTALRTNAGDRTAGVQEQRREFAHRRLVRTVKILADVRRLLRPKATPLDFTRFAEGGRAANQSGRPWPGPANRITKVATAAAE